MWNGVGMLFLILALGSVVSSQRGSQSSPGRKQTWFTVMLWVYILVAINLMILKCT